MVFALMGSIVDRAVLNCFVTTLYAVRRRHKFWGSFLVQSLQTREMSLSWFQR